jgi:hypothetical protein
MLKADPSISVREGVVVANNQRTLMALLLMKPGGWVCKHERGRDM